MSWLLFAIGAVLCFEGLVFALAPSYLEKMLTVLKNMPDDTRRKIGLAALAVGVFLIWSAKTLGI